MLPPPKSLNPQNEHNFYFIFNPALTQFQKVKIFGLNRRPPIFLYFLKDFLGMYTFHAGTFYITMKPFYEKVTCKEVSPRQPSLTSVNV